MCGIAGYLSSPRAPRPDLDSMVGGLRRRGPDEVGIQRRGQGGLGASRLAIVGGREGIQPTRGAGMSSFVMNGEIYNWRDLAARAGVTTTSDTVAAHALADRMGPDALTTYRGAFAMAWLAPEGDRLWMARDEFGQRPLYWTQFRGSLLFASEIRSLLSAGVPAQVDEESLADLITLQFYRPERTLFRGIHTLAPGTWLDGRFRGNDIEITIKPFEYKASPGRGIREVLQESLSLQGQRDVSAGVLLSGGMDSSLVAGGLKAVDHPADLAWVGAFPDEHGCDERPHARAVARSVGVELREVEISALEWRDALLETIGVLEMPVAGPGSVAQFILAREASQEVRVLYGGQGGDEFFGGYERMRVLQALQQDDVSCVPVGYLPLVERMKKARAAFPEDALAPWWAAIDRTGDLAHWSGGMIDMDMIRASRSRFRSLVPTQGDVVDRAGSFECRVQLPGLLHVDDRTCAWSSVESRCPLLDQELAAIMRGVPYSEKSPPEAPRRLFRQEFSGLLPPPAAARRDKMGFPVPLHRWFQGPLRDFANDVLLSRASVERGLVRPSSIPSMLEDDGASGRVVFSLIMLELWYGAFPDRHPAPQADRGGLDVACVVGGKGSA